MNRPPIQEGFLELGPWSEELGAHAGYQLDIRAVCTLKTHFQVPSCCPAVTVSGPSGANRIASGAPVPEVTITLPYNLYAPSLDRIEVTVEGDMLVVPWCFF